MKTIKNKGITLIALVVTIIVLLILAGVSISMLTGENGILKRANEAKEKTARATEDEQRKMAMFEAATNTEMIYFNDVPIPAGFAPTRIAGESTVDEGLVITDSQGNEFVWVPVPNLNDFKIIEGWEVNQLQPFPYDWLSEPYSKGYSDEEHEYEEMRKSVEKNNGFFIGRYETGYEKGTYNTETNSYSKNTRAIIKRNAEVYANIKWGNSATDPLGGAYEVAKSFSKDNGYNTVTSTLCYDVQWDAVLQFFDSMYLNKTCQEDSYVRNHYGNTSGNVMKTGESNDCMKNIYDMGGNVYEWTMSGYFYDNMDWKVARGCYSNPSTKTTASYRCMVVPQTIDRYTGFRIALYID